MYIWSIELYVNRMDGKRDQADSLTYEEIFHAVDDGILVHDANTGAILDANLAAEGVYGYSRDELTEMTVAEFSADRSGRANERAAEEIERALERGEHRFEWLIERKDGAERVVDVKLTRRTVRESQVVLAVVRDITERTEMTEQIERTRAELQAVLDNTLAAVYKKDAEGRYRYVNEHYETLFDRPAEEIVGHTPLEIHGEEMVEMIVNHDRKAVETGTTISTEEEIEIDGHRRTFMTSRIPLLDDGELYALYGIAIDITGLKEREHVLHSLNETAADLINARDPEEIARLATRTAEDVLDLPFAGVWLHDPEKDALVPFVETERSREILSETPTFEEGTSLAWEAFETGDPRTFDDVATEAAVFNPNTPIRAEMVLPLAEHGVLLCANTEARTFDEHDREFGNILAATTTGALTRAEHERELQRRERALHSLTEVATSLIDASANEEIARIAIEAARDVLEIPLAGIWLYEPETDSLVPFATTSDAEAILEDLPAFQEGKGLSWRVFESGTSQVFYDVTTESEVYDPETPLKSEMIFPLAGHGVFFCGTIEQRRFDEHSFEFGSILSTMAASALTSAQREDELREQREFTKQVIGSLPDMFYVFDATTGRFVDWNSHAMEVTGYTPEEIETMEPTAFVADEDEKRVSDAVAAVLRGETVTVELNILTKDGERIPYEMTGAPIRDADGTIVGTCGIGRDVSERLAYERQLERKNTRLEEFASVVAHDIRNPLTVATGYLELAQDAGDGSYLGDVERGLSRTSEIIENLLALARAGEGIGQTEILDLGTLVRNAWENVGTARAQLLIEEEVPIEGDRLRLTQLFENLFRNAIEHGGSDVTVQFASLSHGFYVEDDGPGIPEEQRDELFATRGSNSGDARFGLAIVGDIVNTHGWGVAVTEGRNGGARFEIRTAEASAALPLEPERGERG